MAKIGKYWLLRKRQGIEWDDQRVSEREKRKFKYSQGNLDSPPSDRDAAVRVWSDHKSDSRQVRQFEINGKDWNMAVKER